MQRMKEKDTNVGRYKYKWFGLFFPKMVAVCKYIKIKGRNSKYTTIKIERRPIK